MKNKHTNKANENSLIQLLKSRGISITDAARLVLNILDFKPSKTKLTNMQFCSKIINDGIKHSHIKEISIAKAFEEYLKTKSDLRKESLNTIKYIGKRLLNANKSLAKANFSDLKLSDCQKWLEEFTTPTQFNKAHTMLHGFVQYALRQEWVDKNVVKLIQRKKVIEKEIKALSVYEIKSLLRTTQQTQYKDCHAGLALMLWAGIRPQELQRLKWQDIDLEESIITIRPNTSKTGGARHIEIPKTLKTCLNKILETNNGVDSINNPQSKKTEIAPKNWNKKWKSIRKQAGLSKWTQDVLRHTYASYHAKHFGDLQRLQLNMGHSTLQLLRSRYINLKDITKLDAKTYFNMAP